MPATRPVSLLSLVPSKRAGKKFAATFLLQNGATRSVHFGAKGSADFTIHGDARERKNYILRHRVLEKWSDPTTPGCLSRFLLWEKPTLCDAVVAFLRRFRLRDDRPAASSPPCRKSVSRTPRSY